MMGQADARGPLRIESCGDRALASLLARHPRVRHDGAVAGPPGVGFSQGDWRRHVGQGRCGEAPFGLPELADNNPWVCADSVVLPGPSATLALIAVGPLVRAGLITETPTVMSSAADAGDAEQALVAAGSPHGLVWVHQPFEDDSVLAATAMAAVTTPDEPDDFDALFEEAYSRSFFVRRDETSPWDLDLVRGRPHAVYRLRLTPDEPLSLLTIQVMAARDGKAGAAQTIHALNIMAGFEETLGLEGESTR